MRRILLVLSLVAVLALSAVPAMARDFDLAGDGSLLNDGSRLVLVGDLNDFLDNGRIFTFGDRDAIFVDDDEVVPAASQEFSERRITSGAANPVTTINNSGDNANLCPTTQQVVNTGNVANEQGVVQYASEADDIDFSGSSITIDGSVGGSCTQTIEQAAAAGR